MDQTIKYNLWINGFNVHWTRVRLEKRKGDLKKQKFFRLIRNEHVIVLKELGYYLNNEID